MQCITTNNLQRSCHSRSDDKYSPLLRRLIKLQRWDVNSLKQKCYIQRCMSLLLCYNEDPSIWKWHYEEYRVSGWYTHSYWSTTSKTHWPTLDSPLHLACVFLKSPCLHSLDAVWSLCWLCLKSNSSCFFGPVAQHTHAQTHIYIYIYIYIYILLGGPRHSPPISHSIFLFSWRTMKCVRFPPRVTTPCPWRGTSHCLC